MTDSGGVMLFICAWAIIGIFGMQVYEPAALLVIPFAIMFAVGVLCMAFVPIYTGIRGVVTRE